LTERYHLHGGTLTDIPLSGKTPRPKC